MPKRWPRRAVAVIEDDPSTLRVLVKLLARHHVVTVIEEPHILANLLTAGKRFDAIVSDVWMPVDGKRVHDLVFEVSPTQAARIVYVTGGGLPQRLQRFVDQRIVVYKPIDFDTLLAAVEHVAGFSPSKPPAA